MQFNNVNSISKRGMPLDVFSNGKKQIPLRSSSQRDSIVIIEMSPAASESSFDKAHNENMESTEVAELQTVIIKGRERARIYSKTNNL
jgi:hypothetical protein